MTPERLGEIEAALACECEEKGDTFGTLAEPEKWYNACPEHGEGALQLLAVPVGATRELIAALREAWGVMDEVAKAIEYETDQGGEANRHSLEGWATRLRRGRGS